MKSNFIFLCTALFLLACAGSAPSEAKVEEGKALFEKYCILCHGADGKLQLNGAMDITASELSPKERVALIKNGRNTMTPFEGILTEDQMKAIVSYTTTLK